MMKKLIVNFICMSIAVWIMFVLLFGVQVVAFNYHWPIAILFAISFFAALFDTLCENNK